MATANSITVTALDIINAAMQEIGALAAGETASNEDMNWVLQKMQRLIDRYNARLPMIYNVNFTTFTLPAAPNPCTIGPGGKFDVNQRPVSIPSIGLVLPGTPGVELPLTPRDQDWWANNRIKSLSSTFPTDYYYSPDWPIGNIYFWPVPTGGLTGSVYQSVSGEVPGGVVDGSNVAFTLSSVPIGQLYLFQNGVYQTQGVDYTLSGLNITFVVAPTGTLLADYVSGPDNGTFIAPSEYPIGVINGINRVFTLSQTPTGVIWLFLNGLFQTLGIDYTVSGNQITFVIAPSGADIIQATYIFGSGAPGSGGYQVNVQTRLVLGEYNGPGDTFTMPPAYWDLIVYELAISIGPSFRKEAGATLIGLWKASLKSVQSANISSPRLSNDAPTQERGEGRTDFNFLDGLSR